MLKPIVISWALFGLLLLIFGITAWQMHQRDLEVRERGIACFDIVQLEQPGTEQNLYALVGAIRRLDATCSVERNLKTDYWFMPACYGGIAVWLLNLRRKSKKWLSIILLAVAIVQVLPWIFDLVENAHLLRVLRGEQLGMDFGRWQLMVGSKFIIAEVGAVLAIVVSIVKPVFRRYVNIS